MEKRAINTFLICMFLIITIACNPDQNAKSKGGYNAQWVDSLVIAYKHFHTDHDVAAANKLYRAAQLMPEENPEIYLVVATIYAPADKHDKAFDAIQKAIEAGFKDPELLGSLTELKALHEDPRWELMIQKAGKNHQQQLDYIENPELLSLLKEMWKNDQAALRSYEDSMRSLGKQARWADHQRFFQPVEQIWRDNKEKLDSIIEKHGWPGYRLVGEEGAKISWTIPQHHPDIFFKKKCLALIEQSLKKNDTDPNFYAELNDRIARDTWQKQKYGASMNRKAPHPISDPSHVNQRRYQLGLPEPIEVYALYHGITYHEPDDKKAKEDSLDAYESAQKFYKKFKVQLNSTEEDSAVLYLQKAIDHYGDISNDQLFQAAIQLAGIGYDRAERLAARILKVLIWRRWEDRNMILEQTEFQNLPKGQWKEIKQLLSRSTQQ